MIKAIRAFRFGSYSIEATFPSTLNLFRLKSIKEEVKIAKKDAAVSLCFFPDSNYETRLPFILRNNYEGVHSNQISFPGGKKEKLDEDLIETARRETNEEIGLNRDEMKLQFKLTDIYIPTSNFLVRPYVFKIENEPKYPPSTPSYIKLYPTK